jgi:hypothetical protein
MVQHFAPRAIASARGRARELGLDAGVFSAARRVFESALKDGGRLTRQECYAALASAGIDPAGQRGIHILSRLAMEGLLCLGPRLGKQPTFVLLDEWVPEANPPGRDDGLRLLAKRYFESHGPASIEDFAWWTGMLLSEARGVCAELGLEASGSLSGRTLYALDPARPHRPLGAPVRLLAAFDEYLLGYRDRSACLRADVDRYVTKNGVFLATIVIDGDVAGVWRRRRTGTGVTITCEPFRPFDERMVAGVESEALRFARFVEASVRVEWARG